MANSKPRNLQPKNTVLDDRCVICGGRSDSFHYGVQSCSSCKGFFRRTVRLELVYNCERDNVCDMQGENRGACRACRYAACIRAGMDQKALQEDRGKINRIKRPTPLRRNVLPKLAYPAPGPDDPLATARNHQLAAVATMGSMVPPEILSVLPTMRFDLLASAVAQHHSAIINHFWSAQAIMKKAIIEKLVAAETVGFDGISLLQERKNLFVAASVKTMLIQMQSYVVESIQILKTVPCFIQVPHEDKMPLLRNYAPHVVLLVNIMATMPIQGDFLVLMDGLHIIGRNSTPNAMIKYVRTMFRSNIINEILDELVPRFRELDIDEREFACIRHLTFWNPDIAATKEGKEKVHRVQFIALMTLRHYIGGRCKNEMSAGLRYANILMLEKLVEATGERLRTCLQIMIRDRLIEFNDLLLDIFRDPKARPNALPSPAPSDDSGIGATTPDIQEDCRYSPVAYSNSHIQPYQTMIGDHAVYGQTVVFGQTNTFDRQTPDSFIDVEALDECNNVVYGQQDTGSGNSFARSSKSNASSNDSTYGSIVSGGDCEIIEISHKYRQSFMASPEL